MTRHALDCGLCCGLAECDCGADFQPPQGDEHGKETREEDAPEADARQEVLNAPQAAH